MLSKRAGLDTSFTPLSSNLVQQGIKPRHRPTMELCDDRLLRVLPRRRFDNTSILTIALMFKARRF